MWFWKLGWKVLDFAIGLEILESTEDVQGNEFLDLLERSVFWKLSYLGDIIMAEVSFIRVHANREHFIIWWLAADKGRPLTVCSWAMVINDVDNFKNRADEIVIIILNYLDRPSNQLDQSKVKGWAPEKGGIIFAIMCGIS